jgi:muconate cycloisomerase
MSDQPIAAIELHHVALPTRREHKWTGLTEPIGGYVLVKMIDAGGGVGWGEAPALKDWGGDFGRYFGESPGTTIEVITRCLAPAVKGCMPGEIAELHARMDRSIKGYPYAKAAVELAAYDLAGRQWGLPVHRLLGGAVRRSIPITHSIGLIGPRRPSARSRRLRTKASALSRSKSASSPIATLIWCGGFARPLGLPSRSASTPTRATARRVKPSAPIGAWNVSI